MPQRLLLSGGNSQLLDFVEKVAPRHKAGHRRYFTRSFKLGNYTRVGGYRDLAKRSCMRLLGEDLEI